MDAKKSRYELRYGEPDSSTVDDKNRIVLGPEKQALLGTDFAFWIGKYGFLEAISAEELEVEIERMESAGMRHEAAQHVAMMLIANVKRNNSVQANNRVPIPSVLAKLLGFEKGVEVVVASLGNSCVVASAKDWREFQSDPTPWLKRFKFVNDALKGVDETYRPNFAEDVQ
jgi:DNA-binding transcriptional regulator/RsmH inhibitor MraZ